MNVKKYPIAPNGIFWTLQGEGALQGEPMAFLRLAGCSVGCTQCDTDYRVSRRLTVEEIIAELRSVIPAGFSWPWIWITGGEPTDHDLTPLVEALHILGYRVALATSGVRAITTFQVDFLSVSPHQRGLEQLHGHELKIVPGLNGLTWADVEQLARLRSFAWKYVQPMWYQTVNGPEKDGAATRESLERCIEFVKSHPGWRLTSQAHKYWNLP